MTGASGALAPVMDSGSPQAAVSVTEEAGAITLSPGAPVLAIAVAGKRSTGARSALGKAAWCVSIHAVSLFSTEPKPTRETTTKAPRPTVPHSVTPNVAECRGVMTPPPSALTEALPQSCPTIQHPAALILQLNVVEQWRKPQLVIVSLTLLPKCNAFPNPSSTSLIEAAAGPPGRQNSKPIAISLSKTNAKRQILLL